MSKNTGMPRISPVSPIASGAPFGPNSASSRVVSTSAPPERSITAPSTVPNPMIGAMCPRMPPKPVSISDEDDLIGVPTRSATDTPAARATSTLNDQRDERLDLELDDQEQEDRH